MGIPNLETKMPAARLGVAVVRSLVDVIVTGVLKPGDLLPAEGALTAQFGVSRTVLRESIKRVEEKGLLTVSQGRGTTVNPTSSWDVADETVLAAMIDHDDSLGILDEVSAVRASLESLMARDAAIRASVEEADQLRKALRAMELALDDPSAFRQADINFHRLVMAISDSRLAASIAHSLSDRAVESQRYHGRDPERAFELTIDEHRQVLDAIASGDSAGAEAAMRSHIEGSWQRRRLPVAGKSRH
ncbi:FadR family transcriptional regulator [Arthrobacter sp. CDRTa11]|nr:FadR family transcriptional regulator [Arthrobacter sp. CDRTa11]